MARQKDVIEPRQFESGQWYRQIGLHKYRFRYKCEFASMLVTAERAVANRRWELVHEIHFLGDDWK